MHDLSVCYVASHAIDNALEGHNIASVRIIQAAVNAGINAKIVSLEDTPVSSRKNLYPVKTFFKKSRETSIFPSIWETLSSFPAMLKARNLNSDIVHLLNVTKEIFLLSKKLLRTRSPCVPHFYHSDLPFSAYLTFKIRSLLIKLGAFDHVLSSNWSLIHYFTTQLKLNAKHFHFVPYPIDVNRFRPINKYKLREKYEMSASAPIIAYVGAFDQDRGFFSLLKAFKRILRQTPRAMLYVCHPKPMMEMDGSFYRSVTSQEMKKHIIFHGPNPFIEEIYSLADVIALPFQKPYWITAPPLVLLEAMASATPIVTTPVDVIKEIGTDMVDMIFATPGDLDSLVNAIVYALENQDKAKNIGFRARENSIQNFSMETVGKKLRKTYEKIRES